MTLCQALCSALRMLTSNVKCLLGRSSQSSEDGKSTNDRLWGWLRRTVLEIQRASLSRNFRTERNLSITDCSPHERKEVRIPGLLLKGSWKLGLLRPGRCSLCSQFLIQPFAESSVYFLNQVVCTINEFV